MSADCPAGLHCDLGECIQDCNTERQCAAGLHCSARARCLEEGAPDRDPAPAGEFRAALEIRPSFVRLPSDAETFTLQLSSEAQGPVRFRTTNQESFIESRAPRGWFERTGEVTFDVIRNDAPTERNAAIRVFSDLGEQVIQIVQPAGVAGNYQGSMHYVTQGVDLGEARLALSLWSSSASLEVSMDSETSLLFPATEAGSALGLGRRTGEDAFDFTVQQQLPADFGGARNHFESTLTRRLTAHLERGEHGIWEGEFREQWFGLSERSIDLEGRLSLYPRPGELPTRPAKFELPSIPATTLPPVDVDELLGATPWRSCDATLAANSPSGSSGDRRKDLGKILERFYGLARSVERRFDEGETYADLHELCAAEFRAKATPEGDPLRCAYLPVLACGALEASGVQDDSEGLPDLFASFVESITAPALLMAQQHAVDAIERSLAPGGLAAERAEYTLAVERLTPVLHWLLQPALLGYLRRTSLGVETEPAWRTLEALSRVLELQASLDGERTRLDVLGLQRSSLEMVRGAQERAVLGLLEAAILLDAAGSVENGAEGSSAHITGYLSPLDSAFGALLEGARAFGLPEGFVPFVYRSSEAGNNFEQMFLLAQDARVNQASMEDAYLTNQRIYEASEHALLERTLDLEASYGLQIESLCGSDFLFEDSDGPIDWQTCGSSAGEVHTMLIQVQQTDEMIRAGVARLAGMRDKIQIDLEALAARQQVRSNTLTFVDQANRHINALSLTSSILDVALQAIEIAANSSLWNGGAPAAMSAVSVIIGVQKAGIELNKQQLAQAQSLAFVKQDAQLELISGMADIKKQTIDVGQLALELSRDALAKLETVSRAKNSVEQAQSLVHLRRRAIEVASRDPARDPAFRLVRDQQALGLLDARMRAQRMLFLAGRALEYEVNTPISGLGAAVMQARSQVALSTLSSCLNEIHTSHRVAFGTPQRYTTDVSVREMLGIDGPRVDEVTGEEISAGAQFRLLTQGSSGFDELGNLVLAFSTNLQPDNGLWASDVCSDRISSIQAQLVGDGLGDAEAQVNLSADGTALIRDCGSGELMAWSMGDGGGAGRGLAIIQAGVNSFGLAEPNRSLFGHSVARASWKLIIPSGGQAPQNADIDPSRIDDVVLRIEHQAAPRRDTPLFVDTSCLSAVD